MTQHEPAFSEASAARTPGATGANGISRQYLSFFLGGQEYATDILRVQEIRGWDSVTRVPHSPNYILGVINLRGAIVPVVDPRVRFALHRAPFDSATVVIVVRVAGPRGERIVGLVVDAVSDVYSFAAENIQAPPEAVGTIDQMFVQGLAKHEDKLVIILDIERLVISSVLGDTKAA